MIKRVLLTLLAVMACWAIVVAAVACVVTSMASYRGACRHSSAGWEKFTWYEEGRENKSPGLPGASYFPAVQFPGRFESAGIQYDNYDRVVQCGQEPKYARSVNVVRFTVAPGFQFTPSATYTDAGQVPSAIAFSEPPGDYVHVGARQPQKRYAGDARQAQSWLRASGKDAGRKADIDALGIGWLQAEPLDEAHLLGLWQGGWLFRSARRGYYVWVD